MEQNVMRAAIVIGATSGIGRAVAVRLAAAGYRVGIAGRREELLRELAQTDPDRYENEVLDVEDAGVCERLEKLAERLGSPELVLFCAGTGELNDALDYRLEEATNRVNVAGFTRVVDWAYRYLGQRGGGCLAAITSVMGLRGNRTAPSYAASKAYQINYLEGLRQKAFHQKLPIRIVDLRPGSVRTAMMKGEGHFWIASAEQAARCICKAIEARRTVQYVTPRWRIVGLLLRWMPKWLYQRM